jgi:hypothetical protein
MSARDDYPQLAKLDRTNYVGIGAADSVDVQARNALDEIDELRAILAPLIDGDIYVGSCPICQHALTWNPRHNPGNEPRLRLADTSPSDAP